MQMLRYMEMFSLQHSAPIIALQQRDVEFPEDDLTLLWADPSFNNVNTYPPFSEMLLEVAQI